MTPKGLSNVVIWTDIKMAKKDKMKKTMVDNILKIEHQELKQIAGAPEGLAVPAPQHIED